MLLCVFVFPTNAQAQLQTAPLGSNALHKKGAHISVESTKDNRSEGDTLQLPFIDDFSNEGFAPLNTKWVDYSVFVNRTLAVKPPSLGVATFDGLNAKGEPYANSNLQGAADTLTSLPIDLNYPASDSIYLSFFYQPKGLGNFPEYVDTLLLEFKNPDDTLWTWAWSSKGEDYPQLARDFKQVMVPVNDTAFLKKGFQFRFRNYAQLNGGYDHWHIDYVRLDRNRYQSDTNLLDFSFMYEPTSLLKTYKSEPLNHFLTDAIEHMDENYSISLTTQSAASDFKIYAYYFNNDDFAEIIRDSLLANKGAILSRQEFTFTEAVKYTYEDPGNDWTEFELIHHLRQPVPDAIPQNDTAIYRQVLSNYYALDDGSAEERISINNNGGGFAAQRFETYLGDTLKSIQFYFNRVNDGIIDKPFYLMVWNAGANEPGEIIVNQGVTYPQYNGLNQFHTYELETPIYLPAGSYYFGWAQNTGFDLNVGFDKNTNNNDRIYYNLDGNWYNYSAQEGTMLIRPMFEFANDTYVGINAMTANDSWKIYPNPASENITVELPISTGKSSLRLYEITGRLIQEKQLQVGTNSFSITELPAGVYLAEVVNENGRIGKMQRIVLNSER